jgi:hypothetical protein
MSLPPAYRIPPNLEGKADAAVVRAIRQLDRITNEHEQAFSALGVQKTAAAAAITNITQNVTSSGGSSAGVSSFNSTTGAVSYFPNLGGVNPQTAAYLTQASDNGELILVTSAAPVAVTLNSAISNPYFFFVENRGAGTATLTPSTGNINGVANLILLPGYFTMVFFDGNNWWAMNLPIVPVNTVAVTHQFFTAYNAATGAYSQAQPAFGDVSGTVAASQLPNPTLTTLGGIEAVNAISHQFVSSIDTSGVPHLSQPAFSDISGTPSTTQVPVQSLTVTGSGAATLVAGVLNVPTPVIPLTGATASMGGSPMTVGQTITATAAVAGSTTGMAVVCSPVTYPGAGFVFDSYVSSANTVTVRLTAVVVGTPTASVYNVRVMQ